MAALRQLFLSKRLGKVLCGGSIVGSKYVLTAAHCLYGRKKHKMIVCVHCSNIWRNFHVVHILTTVVHHDYDDDTLENDVGIVVVKKPFDVSPLSTSSICLFFHSPCFRGGALMIGWGGLTSETHVNSHRLREGSVSCTPEICDTHKALMETRHVVYVEETMICCNSNVHGPGYGDSGGPVVVSIGGYFIQIGIISSTFIDDNITFFLNTKVSAFNEWVEEIMKRFDRP